MGIDMYFFSVASLVTFLVTALKVVMALVVVLSVARPATTVVALVISAASKCLI